MQKNSKFGLGVRLPPKLGPDGLGTLIGVSGVKFRVGLHPPEVGRPQFDNFSTKKLIFDGGPDIPGHHDSW